jgi:ADP-ribose pyrophosphatase YjhB (NUDIX family)
LFFLFHAKIAPQEMTMEEQKIPQWLVWARKVEAIAQAGLHYSENGYDLDRYRQLKQIAAGYATPKVDVRAAVFNQGKLLMVRERIMDGWTLPGGWADVGDMPANAAEREAFEEAGYQVKATRLIGVYDANRIGELRYHHAFKLVFQCELLGGEAATSLETSDVGWFGRDEIPQPFSGERTNWRHIEDAFRAIANPDLPTIFD